VKQEMMQGSVRQKASQEAISGSNPRSDGRGRGLDAPVQKYNGTLGTAQESFLLLVDIAVIPNGFEAREHHGKRFFFADFPRSKAIHGLVLGGSDRQMEASQPLDGHNGPPLEGLDSPKNRFPPFGHGDAVPVGQPRAWTAFPAGIGLGVKPAVGRVLVLFPAFPAHDEPGHGRLFPVVGNVPDDGVPGTAIGAIDVWIAVASIPGIQEFPEAVLTGAGVGGNEGGTGIPGPTPEDAEPVPAGERQVLDPHGHDPGQGGELPRDVVKKILHTGSGSRNLDLDPVGLVSHPPAQPVRMGQLIQVRPKTDSLDYAVDVNQDPSMMVRGTFTHSTASCCS